MAYMTLPAEHSEADALLAERIGQTLGLEEVHVFWTQPRPRTDTPAGAPTVPAALGVLGALAALGTALFGRIVAPRR